VSSSASRPRAASDTLAPARANASAAARPKPLEAPVITTTAPANGSETLLFRRLVGNLQEVRDAEGAQHQRNEARGAGCGRETEAESG
jgi:hypothetical protein